MRSSITAKCAATLAFVLFFGASSLGQVILHADMSGSQEVPPNASPATGVFDATLSGGPGAWVLNYTITYSGLTAGMTDSHIHNAPPGVNGPVVHGFDNRPLGQVAATFGGDWRFDDATNPLTDLRATQLQTQQTYTNIHTSSFPGGEIRGLIVVVPEPTTACLIGIGAATALIRRRRR